MTAISTAQPCSTSEQAILSLRRRLACLLYEVLVLFGVALLAGALGAALFAITGVRHDMAVQLIGFVVFGLYFVWYWSRSGQTLPMQTWRIQLVTHSGGRLTVRHAAARYLLAWAWVLPGAVLAHAAGLRPGLSLAVVGIWAAFYALSSLLLPGRQFWHDVLCRTRLIQTAQATHTIA